MWGSRWRDLRAEQNQLRAEHREDMRDVWAQFRRVSDAMKASQESPRWQRGKVTAAVIGGAALIVAKLVEIAPQLIEAITRLVGALNGD